MKTFLTLFLLLPSISVYCQKGNINNTLGSGGSFNIKDRSITFFSLYSKDGSITLSNIKILKGADRFIHDYQAPGSDGQNIFIGLNAGNFSLNSNVNSVMSSYNTSTGAFTLSSLTLGHSNSAFGYSSLYLNTTGNSNSAFGFTSMRNNTTGSFNSAFGNEALASNTTGNSNSAFGSYSLTTNTTGFNNSAFGNSSLTSNTTGFYNSAFGSSSLYQNTTGVNNSAFGFNSMYYNLTGQSNSAFGAYSLNQNSGGHRNSAVGVYSLQNNTSGSENSAFGIYSMKNNSTGNYNTAFGNNSLASNTTGSFNTAVGYGALNSNTTGSFNTAIGCNAGFYTYGSNNIEIGYNANVPNPAGNNQARIGNDQISYAGIQVAWSIGSDRRWKRDIVPSNLGLEFISKLNPVSYIRKNDERGKSEYGFIAQEVEKVLQEYKVENSGMITVDHKGYYELRYSDLLSPIVKAIQELKAENDRLSEENNQLKDEVTDSRVSVEELVKQEIRAIFSEESQNKDLSLKEKKN